MGKGNIIDEINNKFSNYMLINKNDKDYIINTCYTLIHDLKKYDIPKEKTYYIYLLKQIIKKYTKINNIESLSSYESYCDYVNYIMKDLSINSSNKECNTFSYYMLVDKKNKNHMIKTCYCIINDLIKTDPQNEYINIIGHIIKKYNSRINHPKIVHVYD